MNTTPIRKGWPVEQAGCGYEALRTRERAFWQSRDPKHRLPELVDLEAFARAVRQKRNPRG